MRTGSIISFNQQLKQLTEKKMKKGGLTKVEKNLKAWISSLETKIY